jgi:adenine-specific DNA-methyltransferase
MKTESIKYTGSKDKIIPEILNHTKNLKIETVLDGFAGTTRVAQAFKKHGYSVDSNDLEIYSYILGKCYIENNKNYPNLIDKINHLNNLEPVNGWFSKYYGGISGDDKLSIQSDGLKRPWQLHNTMKLDAIRDEIDIISEDDNEKSILLTSLLLALDKVDNTVGHQVSYVKKWSDRSYNNLNLLLPSLIIGNKDYNVYQKNIFDIDNYYDLIYLDPPYGTNNETMPTTRVRYKSYYHLWTTIIKNDKPELVGKALRRKDSSSDKIPGAITEFENTDYDFVLDKLKKLIDNLNCHYIIFSYNNKGKLKYEDIIETFSNYKILIDKKIEYKENVMKNMKSTNEWIFDDGKNYEYLFLIEK